MRRVDLAIWALWTSPKFATGVKYQFDQGFWPDQRSGNPNHPSPHIKTSSSVFYPRADPSLQTQAPRLQFCPKAGLPLQTQEPRVQFYWGWIGAIASHCFPHPTLSLASEQTLKDLKRSQGTSKKVRRVELANWALWTSSKFTTCVKYQFHQGFWPDQRSRNPKHPSPPIYMRNFIIIVMLTTLWHDTIMKILKHKDWSVEAWLV